MASRIISIFYRFDEVELKVLRVLHGARDLETMLDLKRLGNDMNYFDQAKTHASRRTFLARGGVGAIALGTLMHRDVGRASPSDNKSSASSPSGRDARPTIHRGLPGLPHHAPRIKRVIHLYMAGGPSHLETFDFKPKLAELSGQLMPASVTTGQPIAQLQDERQLFALGPQFKFTRCGQSGQLISELFPHLGSIADDLCIIRSMHTDAINHDPAHTLMNTGTTISGRPSIGAWVWYGLGSAADDLPGFVVLAATLPGRSPQPISTRMWHSGFLPGQFQGVELRSKGDPVLYLNNPSGVTSDLQRDVLNAAQQLNRKHEEASGDPEVAVRIQQYELAFKMQTSVPELMDIRNEPQHVRDLYGVSGPDGSFAYLCLLARRLAERGVRFIQVYLRDWDHHDGLNRYLPQNARAADQASAALVKDLKQRGMFDDTLIVWGGEFGRTPMAQTNKGPAGRDHHMKGYSLWLAGGGIRGGLTYGATDDLGYHATENRVHVNDLHATMLHLLGVDHLRLTSRFQGRDFRLTDVAGEVVRGVLR